MGAYRFCPRLFSPAGFESRQSESTGLLRTCLTRLQITHSSVGSDCNRLRRARNDDLRLKHVSIGSDKVTVLVQLQFPVPRLREVAVRLLNLKEAVALNHKIERIIGLGKRARGEDNLVDASACRDRVVPAGTVEDWPAAEPGYLMF